MSDTAVWMSDVDEEGVITFPEDMIASLGWKEGDILDFRIHPDKTITVTKADAKPKLDPGKHDQEASS